MIYFLIRNSSVLDKVHTIITQQATTWKTKIENYVKHVYHFLSLRSKNFKNKTNKQYLFVHLPHLTAVSMEMYNELKFWVKEIIFLRLCGPKQHKSPINIIIHSCCLLILSWISKCLYQRANCFFELGLYVYYLQNPNMYVAIVWLVHCCGMWVFYQCIVI